MQKSQAHSIKDWTAFIGALGALALAVKGQVAPNEPEGEKAREATEASYEALRSAIVDSGKQVERLSVYVEELREGSKTLEGRLHDLEHDYAANGREHPESGPPPPPPPLSGVGLGRIGTVGHGAGAGGTTSHRGIVSVTVPEGDGTPTEVTVKTNAESPEKPPAGAEGAGPKPWAQVALPTDLKTLIPLAATKAKEALVGELQKKVEQDKRLQDKGK